MPRCRPDRGIQGGHDVRQAGFGNIFAAPEYSLGAQSQWVHLLAHLTIGLIVPSLMLWGVASLVMLINKKVVRRTAVA